MFKLSKIGAYISSLFIIALVVLILVEIFGRGLFNYSTMLADEYSGYFYLSAVFFGLAYTFADNGHIRINIITSRLSENSKRWVDIFAGVLNTLVLIFALFYSYKFMLDSKEMEMVSEGVSETPIWLTQIPMSIGLAMFVLVCVAFVYKRLKNDI